MHGGRDLERTRGNGAGAPGPARTRRHPARGRPARRRQPQPRQRREAVDGACVLTGARYGVITTVDGDGQPRDFVTSGFSPDEHRAMETWPDRLRLFGHLSELPAPLWLPDLDAWPRRRRCARPAFHVAPWMASTVATASSKVGMPGTRREAGRGSPPERATRRLARARSRASASGHEGEAAEAERAALAVDDEPLHPVAGAGRFDVQVESVAVAVSARLGDAAAESALWGWGRLGLVFRGRSAGASI